MSSETVFEMYMKKCEEEGIEINIQDFIRWSNKKFGYNQSDEMRNKTMAMTP